MLGFATNCPRLLAATLTPGGDLPASVRVTAILLDPLDREGHLLFVQAPLA